MGEKSLILETSQRVGTVALGHGDAIMGERRLDEARRHARDLVPFCRELLAEQGWKAKDIDVVIVSRGPGSYTGLRVGIMSAKTLAYAVGCAIIGVDTFHALAEQAPSEAAFVEVLEDAQQGRVYRQCFKCLPDGWTAGGELQVLPFDAWREDVRSDAWITGPALQTMRDRLPPDAKIVARDAWCPLPASLLALGMHRYRAGQRDDVFALEPLYSRPSQAEQQWKKG